MIIGLIIKKIPALGLSETSDSAIEVTNKIIKSDSYFIVISLLCPTCHGWQQGQVPTIGSHHLHNKHSPILLTINNNNSF